MRSCSVSTKAVCFCGFFLTTLCFLEPARAGVVFYGLDQGAGAGGAHPNADAARASFLGALRADTVGIEGFEGQPLIDFHNGTLSVVFAPTSTTGVITDRSTIEAQVCSGPVHSNSIFPASGSKFLMTGTAGGTPLFDLDLSTPQTAIGFYVISFSNYYGAAGGPYPPIQISIDNGPPLNIFNMSASDIHDYSVGFFGVTTDAPFTHISIVNPPGTVVDEGGFDDLIIGQVPEPATLSLLALGGLAVLRRRK